MITIFMYQSCPSMVSALETRYSPGGSWFSTLTIPLSTIMEKRWQRMPMPCSVKSNSYPMALLNRALPSPAMMILSPTSCSLPQAPITKASFTDRQIMESIPFSFNAAALFK